MATHDKLFVEGFEQGFGGTFRVSVRSVVRVGGFCDGVEAKVVGLLFGYHFSVSGVSGARGVAQPSVFFDQSPDFSA
jgi:hypothetical protein